MSNIFLSAHRWSPTLAGQSRNQNNDTRQPMDRFSGSPLRPRTSTRLDCPMATELRCTWKLSPCSLLRHPPPFSALFHFPLPTRWPSFPRAAFGSVTDCSSLLWHVGHNRNEPPFYWIFEHTQDKTSCPPRKAFPSGRKGVKSWAGWQVRMLAVNCRATKL